MSKSQRSTACGDGDSIPQQLKEVLELMNSINRLLEDCAVEWQSTVSQKQWRIIDSRPASEKPWENSVLARTYFTQKSLDEAFMSVLSQNRSFHEQLKNFVALLRGDEPLPITSTVRDAESQCPDSQIMDYQEQSNYPIVSPLDLSLLEDCSPIRKTRKSKRLAAINPLNNTIEQSFEDLMKAKINLDTKFIGFEAALSGKNAISIPNETSCVCQICSNVLSSAIAKGNTMKNITAIRQKVQKVTKAKSKRLTKSSRTWTRRKPKNPTVSLTNIGDQLSVNTSQHNHEESIVE